VSGSRSESWKLETLLPSSHFLDYIPGRDALVPADVLAAGVHAVMSCACAPCAPVMPPSADGPHDARLGNVCPFAVGFMLVHALAHHAPVVWMYTLMRRMCQYDSTSDGKCWGYAMVAVTGQQAMAPRLYGVSLLDAHGCFTAKGGRHAALEHA
jgi:hypothetical protein